MGALAGGYGGGVGALPGGIGGGGGEAGVITMLMSQTSMLRASEAEEELAKISDMIALTLSQSSGITHCVPMASMVPSQGGGGGNGGGGGRRPRPGASLSLLAAAGLESSKRGVFSRPPRRAPLSSKS